MPSHSHHWHLGEYEPFISQGACHCRAVKYFANSFEKELVARANELNETQDKEGSMELILTDAEKAASTWVELDDAALGKAVKAMMCQIKITSDEQEKLMLFSASIILCSVAVEANADKLVQTIEGLTIKGQPFCNWKVTIKKQTK